MEFEYDPNKSQLNKAKHGIDFEEAKGLWEAEKSVEYAAKSKTQTRMIRIAALKQKLWVCVFTLRGQKIRIISVRHLHPGEKKLYEQSND